MTRLTVLSPNGLAARPLAEHGQRTLCHGHVRHVGKKGDVSRWVMGNVRVSAGGARVESSRSVLMSSFLSVHTKHIHEPLNLFNTIYIFNVCKKL